LQVLAQYWVGSGDVLPVSEPNACTDLTKEWQKPDMLPLQLPLLLLPPSPLLPAVATVAAAVATVAKFPP
jgi:hypothetical protein